MTERLPTHRSEHTGDTVLDRLQNNVRELLSFVRQLVARVTLQETTHGTQKFEVIPINDQDITLTTAQATSGFWIFEGALTAQRTVFVPRAVSKTAYSRLIFNNTTGGFSISLTNPDGSLLVGGGAGYLMVVTDLYGPETWL